MADKIKTITVSITDTEIQRLNTGLSPEMHVLWKLRKAGIPVQGVFMIRGVERGVLDSFRGKSFMGTTYIWRDTE